MSTTSQPGSTPGDATGQPPATPYGTTPYNSTPYSSTPGAPGAPGGPYGQQPFGQPPFGQAPQAGNGLAVAGFVLSLLALFGSWIPIVNVIAILMALVGVALAVFGLLKARKVGAGKGLAIAGIVLGALAVVIAIVANTVLFTAANEVNKAIEATTDTSVTTEDGTAADDDLGTTRENPAPLGSGVSGGDWTVTVDEVTEVDSDGFEATAAQGSVLLQVTLTARYDGDDPQGESSFARVAYVSPGGTTFDTTSGSTMFIAEDTFPTLETVYSGASVSGNQVIEVPEKDWDQGVLAVTPSLLSDDTFIAVK